MRDRDVLARPAVQNTGRPALWALADRAVGAPVWPPLLARVTRAELLREAVVVGSRRRAEGGDVIALAMDFLVVRAELCKRRQRPANAPAGARSLVGDGRVEALIDDVLVALVRGYEESPTVRSSPASIDLDAAADRCAPANSTGASKRE